MTLPDPILRVLESDDPDEAFRALAEALSEQAGLRAAAWSGSDPDREGSWPAGDARARALLGASTVAGPEEGRVVVLPLPIPEGRLRLLLGPGAPDAEQHPDVERLARAFARVTERGWRLARAERERDELRQRAEESEALHVLGLAANRTLDPEEVVTLVARSTRTLLGAHYALVATSDAGQVRTVATVGLRTPDPSSDSLADRVIRLGKPVLVDVGVEPEALSSYPLHAQEGMRAGLGVPLSLFGDTFGALVVGYRRPYSLQPRDTRLALTLAGHAAVAISNARLHRELERAYAELRHAAEAKERFFASMSHELRTPLNAILGYQSLLLDGIAGEIPTGQHNYLASAHRATKSLLLLVNDVLDLSKIEAGKMELMLRPIDPAQVAEEALGTVHPMASDKGLQLHRVFPTAPAPIVTDADRVRQILLNLLSNAVKFTDRGAITVSIGEPRTIPGNGIEPPGQWLEIRVEDTGPGIAGEHQERIFHEFEQVTGPTTRGGTGLGLPISRKLARLLGGDLSVRSQPGSGSTFVLRLPVGGPSETGT